MKILHIYPLPPTRSGITDYAQVFQNAMRVRDRIILEPFTHIQDDPLNSRNLTMLIGIFREIKRLARQGFFRKYDTVWVEAGMNNRFEMALACLTKLAVPKIRLFLTVHDPPHLTKSMTSFFNIPCLVRTKGLREHVDHWIEKRIVRQSTAIFILSRKGRNVFLDRFKSGEGKTHQIPHVAYDNSDSLRKKQTLLNTGKAIGSAIFKTFGFASKSKGAEILLSALKLFLQKTGKNPRAPILIYGGGAIDSSESPYIEELKDLSKRMGIEKSIEFAGYISQTDLKGFLTPDDIFIVPYARTFNYSTSGVLMRILTAGAAVIVTQVNTLDELVQHGCNGLLIPPGDTEAMADAMTELYNDSQFRASLRKNSMDYILRNHSWEVVEEKVCHYGFS